MRGVRRPTDRRDERRALPEKRPRRAKTRRLQPPSRLIHLLCRSTAEKQSDETARRALRGHAGITANAAATAAATDVTAAAANAATAAATAVCFLPCSNILLAAIGRNFGRKPTAAPRISNNSSRRTWSLASMHASCHRCTSASSLVNLSLNSADRPPASPTSRACS